MKTIRFTGAVTARTALIAAFFAAGSGAANATPGYGYVELSKSGIPVLTRCNPNSSPNVATCSVDSLPGEAGYTLVASRSAPIIRNEVTIGTLYDRVWSDGQHGVIFGSRVAMNTQASDATGLAYNVNDLFRQVLKSKPVSVAYTYGNTGATKALFFAGRTLQGYREQPPSGGDDDAALAANTQAASPSPARNNAWVDFRIDANAAETAGTSSANSPWLLAKTKAPNGYAVQPFAFRLLNSDFDDPFDGSEIYTAGYQPTPSN